MMLFIKNDIFTTIKEKYLLSTIAVLTVVGIVLSESRGVWIALFAACITVLFFYKRTKALIFALLLIATFIPLLSVSGTLRQRTVSIVTSFYTEDEKGSTGNRLELMKGALLIFEEHPLLGTGYGDFQSDIKEFVSKKKLKDIPATVHAHNIFFQALAARGIIGFVILIALFTSLVLWGKKQIKDHRVIGGYIIILSALLTIVGGLTENNIEIHRFLAVCGFTIGLIGPYGLEKAAKPCAGTDRVVVDKKQHSKYLTNKQ
jgi:O-antigen ligase